ncbi:MAG: CotH kinase family protein [Ignavibacteriales bacterium]|nr:MAG: CotH kinase family protein [Ignavibacteriales bacterium]
MKNFYRLCLYLAALTIISPPVDTFSQSYNESWKIFSDSTIARVDITVDPAAIAYMYQNVESDSEHYAAFRFRNSFIDETVDSIGFRLRGNTSRHSQKKSFKVSFNTFVAGREFYGLDKMNLNGEHNDPSIIRSKICFDHFKGAGITTSRSNHVRVYINEQYYGLYINVEHIDDEFIQKNFADDSGNLWKCLYPADLDYHGSNPVIYQQLNSGGRPVYELTTNQAQNDFSKLARFITILNNTPSGILPDSIESVIEVHEVLKYFAMNILHGSWDDYWSLMNNYYLYHEPAKDIIHFIPYDYDNTFGVDWFNIDWAFANPYNFPKVSDGPRPLAEKLLAVPQYRNLYTHFLQFYNDEVFKLDLWRTRLDDLTDKITTAAIADTFRTKDYNFTVQDFFDSYSETAYNNQHVKKGLKQFVNVRSNSLPSQLSFVTTIPMVYRIDWHPKNPAPGDSIFVIVSAFSNTGLTDVTIQYTPDGGSPQNYAMSFNPVENTKIVDEADRWIGTIPPIGAGQSGKFSIIAKDNLNQTQTYPRKNPIVLRTPAALGNDLVINEFMADNETTIPDPSGEYEDWIELYNPTASPILLTGRYITDKSDNLTKYLFTQLDLYVNPGEHLVIWCDEQQSQPGIHTNFKLSNDGEYIALVETDGVTIIDSISFGVQKADTSFGRSPDASANWAFMGPTPGTANLITNVDEEFIPVGFELSAYPNPFNPSTTIRYSIPETSDITFTIFDILGREVWSTSEQNKTPGTYEFKWNGRNNYGNELSSGVYFLNFQSPQINKSIKMLLMK